MDQLDRPAGRTGWSEQLEGPLGHPSWTDQLNGPTGRTSWTDQLDGPPGRTNWTDQLDGLAGHPSWTNQMEDQLDGPVLFIWSLGQFTYLKIALSVCTFSQLARRRKCARAHCIACAHVYASCAHVFVWILIKIFVLVQYYHMSLMLRFV